MHHTTHTSLCSSPKIYSLQCQSQSQTHNPYPLFFKKGETFFTIPSSPQRFWSDSSMQRQSRNMGFFNGGRSSDFQNPFFPGFDRTLDAAFSGLHVGGDYGSVVVDSELQLLTRLRLLENNHVRSRALRPPPAATASFCDLGRRRPERVAGELPVQRRNGFSGRFSSGFCDGLHNREAVGELCVEDLRGMFVALSKDLDGCRVVQKLIEALRKEELEMIFSEVMEHVGELMIDPFGNYVVQKLVEVGMEEHRNQILLMVTQSHNLFVTICLNMHGTRAVQKLLEHLKTQEQITLVMAALSPGAVALAKSGNGQHVIQYCLKNFSHQDNKYLLEEVTDNCIGIAMDKSGCCVLQQCVEYSLGKPRERLVAEITANALLLAEDRYGNYVVQLLLGLRQRHITVNLLKKFEGRYLFLSRNKYGSNVVEKCLTEVGEDRSVYIILELLKHPNVSMLLLDPFGNFVIQSALTVSKRYVRNGVIHDALLDLVWRNHQMMRSNQYGKKILSWFDKRKAPRHRS